MRAEGGSGSFALGKKLISKLLLGGFPLGSGWLGDELF